MTDDTVERGPMPSQVILFSLPRSGCHSLERMAFSKQDNLKWSWHPYSNNVQQLYQWMQKDDLSLPNDDDRDKYIALSKTAIETWRRDLEEAEMKRLIHAFANCTTVQPSNPKQNWTHVPDNILFHPGTVPIFTICNPTLTIPPNFRATGALYEGNITPNRRENSHLYWQRNLYDLYVAHGITPIVVDADDYMTSEAFIRHLTATAGLDPEKATEMSQAEKDNMHPMPIQIQQAALTASEGIHPKKGGTQFDLEAEERKWNAEFDMEDARLIKELVNVATPHYEYLWERKLKLKQ